MKYTKKVEELLKTIHDDILFMDEESAERYYKELLSIQRKIFRETEEAAVKVMGPRLEEMGFKVIKK